MEELSKDQIDPSSKTKQKKRTTKNCDDVLSQIGRNNMNAITAIQNAVFHYKKEGLILLSNSIFEDITGQPAPAAEESFMVAISELQLFGFPVDCELMVAGAAYLMQDKRETCEKAIGVDAVVFQKLTIIDDRSMSQKILFRYKEIDYAPHLTKPESKGFTFVLCKTSED